MCLLQAAAARRPYGNETRAGRAQARTLRSERHRPVCGPVPELLLAGGDGVLVGLAVDPGGDPRHPGSGPVLRYFDHVLPLRPGTSGLPLAELLGAQHYELADWCAAAADLNWRRFFDVTTLIGVQVIYQYLVTGILVILAVSVDQLTHRRQL